MRSTSFQCVANASARAGVSGCAASMLAAHSSACTTRMRCLRVFGQSNARASSSAAASSFSNLVPVPVPGEGFATVPEDRPSPKNSGLFAKNQVV